MAALLTLTITVQDIRLQVKVNSLLTLNLTPLFTQRRVLLQLVLRRMASINTNSKAATQQATGVVDRDLLSRRGLGWVVSVIIHRVAVVVPVCIKCTTNMNTKGP